MNSDKLTLLFLALLAVFFYTPTFAAEFGKQAFQSEYELTSSQTGKSIHKLSSDGKGHGRSEMISAQRRSISIIDYGKHQVFVLMPESKMVMVMPLDDKMLEGMGELGQKIRATAKPLGTKLIDGHMCTGTHYDLDGGSSQEIWTGNDIGGTRVYSKVIMPKLGISEAHLKSYLPVAPAADSFVIPPGYANR